MARPQHRAPATPKARCLDTHPVGTDDPRLGPEGGRGFQNQLARGQMRRPRPSAMSLTLWSECKEARLASRTPTPSRLPGNRIVRIRRHLVTTPRR
jgi:hypothetical protein